MSSEQLLWGILTNNVFCLIGSQLVTIGHSVRFVPDIQGKEIVCGCFFCFVGILLVAFYLIWGFLFTFFGPGIDIPILDKNREIGRIEFIIRFILWPTAFIAKLIELVVELFVLLWTAGKTDITA